MKKRLLSLILALTGAVIGYAQTDVTNRMSDITTSLGVDATFNGTANNNNANNNNNNTLTGWTLARNNAYTQSRRNASNTVTYRSGGQSYAFSKSGDYTDNYAYAIWRNGNNNTTPSLTRTATLAPGAYKFTVYFAAMQYNNNTSTLTVNLNNGGTNLATSGAQNFTRYNSRTMTATVWNSVSVNLILNEQTNVTFALNLSLANNSCIFFDKVVLERYTIYNPGFESCTLTTTNIPTTTGGNAQNIDGGWTINSNVGWNGAAVVGYGGTGQINNASAPSSDNASNTGKTLGTSVGWSGEVIYKSNQFSLDAGYYLVLAHSYNNFADATQYQSKFGYVTTDGEAHLSIKSSYAYGTWKSDYAVFSLSAATEGYVQVGGKAISGGSGANAKVFFDNITLYEISEALYQKYLSLEGYIKKAKALNTVMQNVSLTSAINTAESSIYTTEAQIQTQIDALIAAWEAPLDDDTPMVTINNGTFDVTPINVGADGNLVTGHGANKDGTKTYNIPNWTNISDGANSYGNTAVYGTTAFVNEGGAGTNACLSPAQDMFAQTSGGVLNTGSGWGNLSRYQQTLPTLPAGKYIIYYEGYNRHDGYNDITNNYIGISDVTKGNISGTNNSFKFSDLKTYPYNEWVASATEMVLGSPQEGAKLNVGISNDGSSNGKAWLWVDNIELYYLGWDATSALDALNTLIGSVADLNTNPMNRDVCQNMIDKRGAAQDVYDTPAKHTYEQITAAQLNLQQAIAAAQESVAEYERIKARLDQMNTANQRGDISQANFETLPFYTKYSDGGIAGFQTGTYVRYDEVMPLYRTSVSNWWATHASNGSNLTAFVINQGFELASTEAWTYNAGADSYWKATDNATYSMSDSEGICLFNTWADWAATLYIEQEMEGLPNGFYTVKAIIGAHEGKTITLTGTTEGAGNTAETTDDIVKVGDKTVGQEMTLDNVVVNNGKLTLRFENTDGTETFFKLDNVRIYYKTTSLPTVPAQVTGIMRKAAEDEQTAAYAAWNGGVHSAATRARVIVAHDVAQVSHEAYLAAQEAVNRVEALLNNTNVYTYDAYVKFYDFYNIYKAPFDDRTLADNLAAQMEYQIFGNRSHRQKGVPIVEFLGSAWDHAGDYMWNVAGNWQVGFEYNKDAAHNYWVNTWSSEGDSDGSYFKEPFMEYWYEDGQTLADNTLTAVVKAVPGSNNTVTAWIRARIANGQTLQAPTGITLQVAPENDAGEIDVANTVSVTPSWTRIGSTRFYQAHVTLNNGKADPDSDRDGFGDLRIQFVLNGTKASWFSFRDVKVTYGGVTVDWDDVDDAIDEGEGKRLGFWGGEYAPYTNIKALKALEALKAYKAAHDHGDPVNDVLVNSALYTLNGHPGWIVNPGDDWGEANPQEMNAVGWRTNYTKSEIVKAYDYDDNGDISYTFETIIPDGWDLNGRSDGYDTRLMKYGVNTQTGDVGVFANCDSIAMFFKRDTKYGEQLGYTMPLKPNTKYSLTFTYTNWAKDQNEANSFHDNDTYIIIHEKNDPNSTCQIYYSDDDDNEANDEELDYVSQGAEMDIDCGNAYAYRWKAVRAYFTTPNIEVDNDGDGKIDNIDMVIDFSKSIKTRQIQMAIGELYILKYRDQITLNVDGQNTTKGDTNRPRGEGYEGYYEGGFWINTDVKACNITLKRTLKKGQWNSLCLPVKIPYKDMQTIFQVNGKQAVDKVYIYTGTTRSGIYEVLNFASRQGGIQAGQPVLVKPYNYTDNTELTQDVVLVDIPMRNYVVKNIAPIQKDPNRIYDFVGVYGVYNVQQYDVYTKYNSDKGEDELIKKVTSDTKTWLQPTRAFFRDVSVESGRYNAPGEVKLWAFNIDDVETGIMAVEPDGTMTVTSGNIYDLNGRMVRQNATSLEGLPRGLYIVDGRKVMIR